MKRNEQKNKDIVDAALEEFYAHGFEGARVARIAKSADVSTRTLYKHFPDKEALFEAIIEIVVSRTGAIAFDPYDSDKPLRPQLVGALRAFIEGLTDNKYMRANRLAMSEYLRDRELAMRIFSYAEMANNPVQAIVEGGIADGKLQDVSAAYATIMVTGSAKMLFFWPQFLLEQTIVEDADAAYEDCVDMFLAKFGT